jgi:hypothetical protein
MCVGERQTRSEVDRRDGGGDSHHARCARETDTMQRQVPPCAAGVEHGERERKPMTPQGARTRLRSWQSTLEQKKKKKENFKRAARRHSMLSH